MISVGGGGTFPLNDDEPLPERIRARVPSGAAGQPAAADRVPAGHRRLLHDARPADRRRPRLRRDRFGRRAERRDHQPVGGAPLLGHRQSGRLAHPRTLEPGQPDRRRWTTIVGVVADVRQQLDRPPLDEVYVPVRQVPLFGTTWMRALAADRRRRDAADQGGRARARSGTAGRPTSARSPRSARRRWRRGAWWWR